MTSIKSTAAETSFRTIDLDENPSKPERKQHIGEPSDADLPIDSTNSPESTHEKSSCFVFVGRHKLKFLFFTTFTLLAAILIGTLVGIAFLKQLHPGVSSTEGQKAAVAGTSFHFATIIPAKGESLTRR